MAGGGALFRNRDGSGTGSGGPKNLVEFRAGRMLQKDSKMVYPDHRKGYLYIYQSEDSLIHFCWKDRTTGIVEDDLIIFPDDCEFVRVPQCTTGRVYVLKFKTSARKFFFWMQEPKTDKDDEWCKQINDIINNPPSLGGIGLNDLRAAGNDSRIQTLLNGLSQQQFMQLYGMAGARSASLLGSLRPRNSNGHNTSAQSGATSLSSNSAGLPDTPKPPTTSDSKTKASESRHRIQLADLQNYLSSLTAPDAVPGVVPVKQKIDLSTALNVEALQPVISDDKRVAALQPHLPASGAEPSAPREHLRDTLASPQFRQAVTLFSSALQSGQLGPIISQFGVNPEVISAAEKGDLEEFVKALEAAKSSEPKSDDKDKPASKK